MRVSLIGLAQNAANELERIWKENERRRKGHDADCDCRLCDHVDYTGFYAASLRELAEHAKEVKADPAKLDEFTFLYALRDPPRETIPAPAIPANGEK